MTEKIERYDLEVKLNNREDFKLVNALNKREYRNEHIPGSINIPAQSSDFQDQAGEKLPDKSQEVIVYCASPECSASSKAADKLENRGYTNLVEYEGGIEDWRNSGLPLVGDTWMNRMIVKKGGREEAFDAVKIRNAVKKAAIDAGLKHERRKKIVDEVAGKAAEIVAEEDKMTTSELRDRLLKELDETEPRVSEEWRKHENR